MPLLEIAPNAVCVTYAKCLFQSAMAGGGQSAVQSALEELESILSIARQDRRVGEFMSSRIISGDKKVATLRKVFVGRTSDMVANFLCVLADNGRLALLPAIVAAFDELVQASFGRVEVDVYTASPMDDAARSALSASIKAKLGREPVLHCYTDPTLIGGIRLQIGDQLFDASVSTRLRKIRDRISENGLPAVRAAFDKIFRADANLN
ncbi:MAG: ATP synthase F1 subunit delta [Phycisphaerales bacterium]|jgi:F-type H+-transporting ATPase subunit delta